MPAVHQAVTSAQTEMATRQLPDACQCAVTESTRCEPDVWMRPSGRSCYDWHATGIKAIVRSARVQRHDRHRHHRAVCAPRRSMHSVIAPGLFSRALARSCRSLAHIAPVTTGLAYTMRA
jgi:hypothetical protein